MQTKPFWQSKTMWVNGLTIAAMILAFVVDTQTAGGLPLDIDARWLVLTLGVVNIVLRSVTSKGVTGGGDE